MARGHAELTDGGPAVGAEGGAAARASGDGSPGRRSARRPRWSRRPGAGRSDGTLRRPPARARPRSAQPGRGRPSLLELLLQAELAGGAGQQIGEPLHARAASRRGSRSSAAAGPARAVPRARGGVRRSASGPRHARALHDPAPRPSRPGTTRHGRAWRRRSGSMSSGSVVVMKAWGSSAMRRTRWPRRAGSSSLKTSSSSSSGGRPSSAVSRSSSASLKARIAVRCCPREANVARSRPPRPKTRSSRCGPTSVRAVPDLLLGRLAQAPRQRVPRRLPGERRGVRGVARPSAAPRSARSRGGPRPAAPPAAPADAAARRRSPRPAARNGSSQSRSWSRSGLALADRPQQAVALLQSPGVRGHVRGVARIVRRGQPVEGRAAQARRADDEQHLLGREEHGPQMLRQRGRTPGHAVDLDLLAAAGLERQLEAPYPRSAPAAPAPAAAGLAGRRRPIDPFDADDSRRPSGSARSPSWSGASGPARAGRRPRAGSSCRRRSGPRPAAARARAPGPARRSPGDSG